MHNKKKGIQSLLCLIAMCMAVIYTVGLIGTAYLRTENTIGKEKCVAGLELEYVDKFFDKSYVHKIDVEIPPSDWENLKNNSLKKPLYDCNLTIDGEKIYHVGVRTKGNSTLIASAAKAWDRYSLVFDFAAFDPTQRYKGLDFISTYNNSVDISCLKNFISLDMMTKAGVVTPLYNYTAMYLNGEYIGLYITFEGVGESFAARNYGVDFGELYKPEVFDGSGIINGTNVQKPKLNAKYRPVEGQTLDALRSLGISDDVVGLQYVGKRLSNYDEIWVNSVFDIGTIDKQRLIRTIKAINEGDVSETYVDRQQLAKYFAVNTLVLNADSYVTNMAHNYYLYEKDGQISFVPWDNDVAMGTRFDVNVSEAQYINTPIDTPVLGTTMEERPLLNELMNDEKWQAMYHEELQKIIDDYFNSGYFERLFDQVTTMIAPYVEEDIFINDNGALYKEKTQNVRTFCNARAASIQAQLNGQVPATTEEQIKNPNLLEDYGYHFLEGDNAASILVGNDVGVSDVLNNIGDQLNFPVILNMLPLKELADSDMKSSESKPDFDLKQVPMRLIIKYAAQLVMPILAVIALIIALVWVHLSYRKQGPVAVRRKR